MHHVHDYRLIGRCPRVFVVAAVLLAGVAGCDDELNNPEIAMCDEVLQIVVDDAPAIVQYLVSSTGSAFVQSVTYTTPDGDVTTTDLDNDDPDSIVFNLEVEFDEPTDAMLRARGEAATGGEIGITYTVFAPTEAVVGPVSVCRG